MGAGSGGGVSMMNELRRGGVEGQIRERKEEEKHVTARSEREAEKRERSAVGGGQNRGRRKRR